MNDRANSVDVKAGYGVTDPSLTQLMKALIQNGIVPAARLVFITDATDTDTITIGGHVFKFLTALVAANTFTQIKRGTSAAQTRADLVKAINGTASANVVQATTPFAKKIVADVVGTSVRIRWAAARGGLPVAGVADSIALLEGLTPAASIWSAADLNVSGKAPGSQNAMLGSVAITAQMVTNASFQVELPFTPTVVLAFVTSAAGVQRASTDAVTISGNAINIALGGGASPAIQATDVVTILAVE
jgi:hypothetical protein